MVVALVRSVAAIAAAIGLSQPGLPEPSRRAQAAVVSEEAIRRDFDPFTLVSIAHNESHWTPRLVGGMDGKCHGLGQVCVHVVYPYCRQDGSEDGGYESARCRQKRAELLTAEGGIRAIGWLVTENRKFCRKKTGRSALFARWLSSYQGFNDRGPARRGVWCNMRRVGGRWVDVPAPKLTRAVMAYRRRLVRLLG